MVGYGYWLYTSRDTKAKPIGRRLHELGCRRGDRELFQKIVVVGQHDIQPKLFSFSEDLAITRFGVVHLELRSSNLDRSEVANGIVEE